MALDIVIIVVILAALITGAVSGLVRQLGTLVAFVVAVLACRFFGASVVAFCGASSPVAVGCCYVAVFLVAFVLVMLVARLLHATVKALRLGPVNRVLGALFRACLWLVIMSAVANVYLAIAPADKPKFLNPAKPWREWVLKAAPYVVGCVTHDHNIQQQ